MNEIPPKRMGSKAIVGLAAVAAVGAVWYNFLGPRASKAGQLDRSGYVLAGNNREYYNDATLRGPYRERTPLTHMEPATK